MRKEKGDEHEEKEKEKLRSMNLTEKIHIN
jgi:hypothetical protein